jgi:hypothetical protein
MDTAIGLPAGQYVSRFWMNRARSASVEATLYADLNDQSFGAGVVVRAVPASSADAPGATANTVATTRAAATIERNRDGLLGARSFISHSFLHAVTLTNVGELGTVS